MLFMFQGSSRGFDRAGYDMSKLMLLCFVLIVIVLIQFIGDEKESDDAPQQGTMMIEMFWNDAYNTDVDMWVMDPMRSTVSYQSPGGKMLNLLRDDRGTDPKHDLSESNSEIVVSRGIAPGEYTINAHLYSLRDGRLPITIKVVVSMKPEDEGVQQLFAVDSQLNHSGDEVTVIRFSLDEKGLLVEDSVHYTFKQLVVHEDIPAGRAL